MESAHLEIFCAFLLSFNVLEQLETRKANTEQGASSPQPTTVPWTTAWKQWGQIHQIPLAPATCLNLRDQDILSKNQA